MKQGILIIVLLFFMKPIFPMLDFMINYDAIQELCINKDKPELACNGKCHLQQELAKSAEQENPFTSKKTFQLQSEVLFFIDLEIVTLDTTLLSYCTKVADSYTNVYAYLPTFKSIKPPLA